MWVDINERLPRALDEVFVQVDSGEILLCFYRLNMDTNKYEFKSVHYPFPYPIERVKAWYDIGLPNFESKE